MDIDFNLRRSPYAYCTLCYRRYTPSSPSSKVGSPPPWSWYAPKQAKQEGLTSNRVAPCPSLPATHVAMPRNSPIGAGTLPKTRDVPMSALHPISDLQTASKARRFVPATDQRHSSIFVTARVASRRMTLFEQTSGLDDRLIDGAPRHLYLRHAGRPVRWRHDTMLRCLQCDNICAYGTYGA